MAIRSPCECGYVYFAPIQEAGTTVVCPGCGIQLSVPLESDDADDANGSENPESGISLVDDAPHDEPSLDESAGGKDDLPVRASLVDEPTECPSCGSLMPPRSVLCVHCGYDRRSGRRLQTRADSELLDEAEAEIEEEASEEEAALAEGLSKKVLFISLGTLGLFMLLSLVLGPPLSIPLAGLLLVPGGAILAVMQAMGGGTVKAIVLGVVLSFVGILMICCGGVMLRM